PASSTPLHAGQPLLQLVQELPGSLVGGGCRIRTFGERVDELEQRAVVDTLVGRERLDVPAHELAQDPLDQPLGASARLGLGGDRPEAPRERPRRRELCTRAPAGSRTATQLLAETLEEVCYVEIVRRGSACRRRVFRFRPGHSGDCTVRVCQWSV